MVCMGEVGQKSPRSLNILVRGQRREARHSGPHPGVIFLPTAIRCSTLYSDFLWDDVIAGTADQTEFGHAMLTIRVLPDLEA